jgi:hypothetical protein
VKLLEAQPEVAPAALPETPGETPQGQPAGDPAVRACTSCGAAMEPGQDWCLQCGAAAGRLGERPGWRSAMTVLGLTLVLVAGAVAASFAALSDDRAATGPATSTGQVAQLPPAATTAPPAATATTPTTPTETGGEDLPKVDAPSSGRSPSSAPRPASPGPTGTTRSTTPAPPAPVAPSTPSTGSAPSSGSSGSDGGSGSETPARPAPEAIELADSAASVYDPYGRATATAAPGRALDGEAGTSWYVDPPAGAEQVGVGYALNLGASRGVRVVEITTPTPGFRVEIYASDEATAPPNILDTRWAHITDKSDVGEGGTTRIVLGAGTSKYQTLLLWITTPPSDGTRVRISELKVLG